MSLLLNNMTHLPSILHSWGVHGVKIGLMGDFRLEASEGGLTFFCDEGFKLKKGDNTITLPSLSINTAAILLDVSEEILAAAASVRSRRVFADKENTPTIHILCTEATKVYKIASIHLLKGTFR